ncbi:MAG: DEAD/DEAH box helicase, partial [Actinobacteria bacterium]|nr:DEAD/DEAH box helicase [Actinomycetota bacterium]
VSGTASGKTLCYNAPVVQAILDDPQARALYLFPTKALAQDQLDELYGLVQAAEADIKTFTYDGDTAPSARRAVRQAGHIVITNPDMLHQGILPHHTGWTRLFENLRTIVIDELHIYRGVFGSHLANVIRRLLRVAAFYGARPQFICCSATIANPKELADKLTGRDVRVVDDDGAPRGEKHYVFYNPPVVNAELGLRASSLDASAAIARLLLGNDIQSLVFARSRTETELLLSKIRDDPYVGAERVRGYRGGYLPAERRDIEQGLREGRVRTVVATNALELGVDIGQMQAVVLCGYPGSLASTWQQLGRAGRRHETSLAVFVAGSNPLDQFLARHPTFLFEAPVESGLVNPENIYVYTSHLKCAAFELPFTATEQFGVSTTQDALNMLAEAGVLHRSASTYHWMADDYPAQYVSLRTGTLDNVVIVSDGRSPQVIGQVDRFSAPTRVHTDAIYLHDGRQYHVSKLDWEQGKAYVEEVSVEHYTVAQMDVRVSVLREEAQQTDPALGRAWGDVRVTSTPTIYKKLRMSDNDNVGWGTIDLPAQDMHTVACWTWLRPGLAEPLGRDGVELGLRGAATLLANVAALYLMCDARDLGIVTEVKSPFTGAPTITLYDRYPGGVGLTERLFVLFDQVLDAARELVTECDCAEGCPACVGPPPVPGAGSKGSALEIMRRNVRVPPARA